MCRQLMWGLLAVTVAVAGVAGDRAWQGAPRAGGAAGAVGPMAPVAPGLGSQVWVARYQAPGNGHSIPSSVAVSPAGRTVFVTGGGSTGGISGYDYATVAYNAATGAQEWIARYHGPGNGNSLASSVAVSPSGRTVFVTGSSRGTTPAFDYATVAYNAATGAQEWVARYHGPGNGNAVAFSVAVSPAGRAVFVTGYSRGTTSGHGNATTVAYNAATGAQEWVARYHGPVTHYSQESRYQGPAYNAARSVAVSPSGRTVFVTGQDAGTTPAFDYATVAYDATTGAQEWVARYSASGGAEALAVSPDGGTVFVFGGSYVTVAYHG